MEKKIAVFGDELNMSISSRLIERMKSEGLSGIRVVVGGVIPKNDIPKLKEMGVDGVFPNGTAFKDIIQGLTALG